VRLSLALSWAISTTLPDNYQKIVSSLWASGTVASPQLCNKGLASLSNLNSDPRSHIDNDRIIVFN
jgi:hypothetical protein